MAAGGERAPRLYTSPPHEHSHALELVGVLLRCPAAALSGEGPWLEAIAGGQRSVRLHLADRLFA